MSPANRPRPGSIVTIDYAWPSDWADRRRVNFKERPCVIMDTRDHGLSTQPLVLLCPITHRKPEDPAAGIAISRATRQRCGLDSNPSWLIVSTGNQVSWDPTRIRTFHGLIPDNLFEHAKEQVLGAIEKHRFVLINRDRGR